jgi:predicted nucleic acid-binding protein
MSSELAFVDTNIFVYAYDSSSGEKHFKSKDLISKLWEEKTGVVSVQVFQELATTLTRKIPRALSHEEVIEIISDLSHWQTINSDAVLVIESLKIAARYKISTWDGLIVAAAKRGNCKRIYSEDLNPGQKYSGIKIVDPLKN